MTTSAVRVLHVGKFYPPASGGMERVVQMLCESTRHAVDSRVLVANDRPATVKEEVNGIPVVRAGALRRVGAVALCPTFPWWLWRLRADVMVIHEPNPVALVAHAIVRPRTPVVVWMHAEVVRPQWRYRAFYRPFLTRLLRRASAIVVSSAPMLEHAVELQPYLRKCHVIPFAIDPEQHALPALLAPKVAAIRRERPEPLALFVGRMVPYKGVDVLLRALARSSARAVLVGEGPMREEWERLAASLGLGDRVRFAGEVSVDDLTVLYNACDFFVLPSVTRAEAFGMVQIEAMACAKPVVSTQLPSGVPWVNQHGHTGLVVPPGDVEALAAAIDALAGDPLRRAELGANGRARVLAEFSLARVATQTTALYRSLAREPQSNAVRIGHQSAR